MKNNTVVSKNSKIVKKYVTIIGSFLVIASLAGCSTNKYDPNVYKGSQANIIGGYQSGVITSIRNVEIQDKPSGVGAVAGTVVGVLVGSQIGGGTGQYIGAAVGAIGGGVAGNSVENSTSANTKAHEITTRLNNGSEVVIVQENTQALAVGDSVKLMSNNGNFTIVK